jgi:hypothetical protein
MTKLRLILILATLALVPSARATDTDTFLTLNSQPGDFVGGGITQTFTPGDGTFTVGADIGGAAVSFHTPDFSSSWDLIFGPPKSETFRQGEYEGAQNFFGLPTAPLMAVGGDHRGCNVITGRFLVSELALAPDGTLQRLAIDFEQHCEGAQPALFGSVRFNSDVPVLPRLSVGDATVLKGNVGTNDATATVSLSMLSTQLVTVHYKTAKGTALPGKDYVAKAGKVTFLPGTTSQTITIPIIGDRLARGNKSFRVLLSDPDGVPMGDGEARVTILDPNVPLTVLSMYGQPGDSINPGQLLLTAADASFTTTRNFLQGVHVAVNNGYFRDLQFAGPTNAPLTPGDYENARRIPFQPPGSPGLIVDGAGVTCGTTLTGRFVVLQASYASNGDVRNFAADFEQHCDGTAPALFGSIRVNSNLRQLSVSNAVISRRNSTAVFTVTLNPPSETTVLVNFVTADGTAIAGGDYFATVQTVSFAPGESAHKVAVLLVPQPEDGPAKEFFGQISAPSGAPIWISQGSAILKPDDDGNERIQD